MGEAKRRMQTDPNFGRVPKNAGFRGLIVSPPIKVKGCRLTVSSTNLDPQELRFSLLFWDQLVWPTSSMLHFECNDDEAFLESAGVLTRPNYPVYGDMAQGVAKVQIASFSEREQAQPGVWALAQGENTFFLESGLSEEGKGTLVELHRAIPIPKEDVPLAEILEFKQRRRDELVLLRYELESFFSEIQRSNEKEVVLQRHLVNIDRACANLLVVGKEWQFPVYLSNIKASFSLDLVKLLTVGVAGGIGSQMGGTFGLVAATAAAGLSGAAKVEIKGDLSFRPIRSTSPYRYAYQLHQELN